MTFTYYLIILQALTLLTTLLSLYYRSKTIDKLQERLDIQEDMIKLIFKSLNLS